MFQDEWVKFGSANRSKAEWIATRLSDNGVPYWLDVLSGDPVTIMVRADYISEAHQVLVAKS